MKLIICLFSVLFISQQVRSSEFFDNVKEDATSPFTTDAIKILEIGGGLTVLTLLFPHEIKDKLQKNISRDRPLKQYSKWGDFLGHSVPNIAYALFMGSDYLLNKDQASLDRTILMTKATIYSGAMTDIMKRVVRETRPNGGAFSFPSGHSTTAFAFSSVISMEHSLAWGIAANSVAAFVGFSRMNDNAHYLHDVIAGATIGSMYGVGVYYAQKNRQQKVENPSVFMLYPVNNGLAANYTLSF